MKKLMVFALALGLLTPVAGFAAELDDAVGITLSNQVEGTYFSGGTNDSAYQLSTVHLQGNRAFGSGSAESEIFYQEVTTDPTDLLIEEYVFGVFTSDGTWKAVGGTAE